MLFIFARIAPFLSVLSLSVSFLDVHSATLEKRMSFGLNRQKNNKNQTYYVGPQAEKSFRAENTFSYQGEGLVYIGFLHKITTNNIFSVGLQLQQTGSARFSGIIWDDADPDCDNRDYSYQVSHSGIYASTRLYHSISNSLHTYVEADLGIGFNRAYNYYNTPRIIEALPDRNFGNHTQSTLSYGFALGVEHPVGAHINTQLGLGYQDWGKSQLSRAPSQDRNSGLSLKHIRTTVITFGVSHKS